MMNDQLLTVVQVAERLAVSPRTIGRMYRTGEIPYVRVRGRVLIKSTDIEKYIEDHYFRGSR
ncbi:excisionase family DNA-binding protein [Rhodococcus hoagii]|nr:excisionase family DNA-binding protein [Prescottella equi]